MRLPGKRRQPKAGTSPEDTQEMFTAGGPLPEAPEETREYDTVVVEEPDPEEPAGAAETAEEVVEEEETMEAEPVEEETAEEETAEEPEFEEDDPDELEEIWEEDEYEEWDEDPEAEVEDPEAAEGSESGQEPEATGMADQAAAAGEAVKVWLAAFLARSRTVSKGVLTRIGQIRIPRHEIDGQKAMAAGGILLVALLVGAGGYLLGKGSGDDIDQARLEGEFAGKKEGAIEGATRGYAAGFKKGRDISFRRSYEASYRRNYIRAYENAGMDAPKAKNIEVPKP